MKYFLDCEFNGYRGALISLALVCEDGRELYMVERDFWKRRFAPDDIDPWVQRNVMPFLAVQTVQVETRTGMAAEIERFLDPAPVIVADWPDDIRYFCECLIVGPGEMIKTAPRIFFNVERVDAYPTDLPGAVQHNALWDARALRHKLLNS